MLMSDPTKGMVTPWLAESVLQVVTKGLEKSSASTVISATMEFPVLKSGPVAVMFTGCMPWDGGLVKLTARRPLSLSAKLVSLIA